jgi:pimeloyl-ACP methyl ester carboxylesterase
MRVAVVCCLLVASAAAETVRFKTADGIEIAADYFKGKKHAPSVICIPMYRNARASYKPLVLPLHEKGFHVLLIDTRGHGESAPDLKPKVEARDPAVFRAMHFDVEAAIAFLESKGCDATRIGLCGASVGCSVAVDATVRNTGAVRAVVLLTPGSNYLGMPTLKHLKKWRGTAVFTFTSSEEEKTSAEVIATLRPFDASNHFVVPGKGIHGTRMLNKVASIEQTIANFFESRMSDVRVPNWGAAKPPSKQPDYLDRTLRIRRTVVGKTYTLMLYAVADGWELGAIVNGPFQGKLRILIDGKPTDLALNAKSGTRSHFLSPAPGKVGKSVRISAEFRPVRGKRVRIPAKGEFTAHLQPARDAP